MEYRTLGSSGLKVSVIGFGAWGIGGPPFWQNDGDAASEAAIHAAFEAGINLFDTAPVYGFGRSERLIGRVLAPYRDQVILATKCGLVWEREEVRAIRKDCSRKSILREVEASRERLQTDTIDLYQVHWPDDRTSQEETISTLVELQEQGKIRQIGVSNYSLAQLQEALPFGDICSLQSQYNLLYRELETALIPFCRDRGIGILAYSPLASGLLTGKYTKSSTFTDWRKRGGIGDFSGPRFQENMGRIQKISQAASSSGVTTGEMAINWVIHQPGVTSALVGVKNQEHVEANLQAVGWRLPPQRRAEIEAL